MKVLIQSDLHLEFRDREPMRAENFFNKNDLEEAEVIVLAGDLSVATKRHLTIDFIKSCAEYARVIFTLGNHDFYGSTINKEVSFWADSPEVEFLTTKYPVNFLHNSSVAVGDLLFAGGTLFTDGVGSGDPLSAWETERVLPDFKLIKREDGAPVSLKDYEREFEIAKDSIDIFRAHAKGMGRELVVVTHHLPSEQSSPERFRGSLTQAGFASYLDDYIEESEIHTWIHGHTHDPCDYYIGNTRVVCEPRGYPHERGTNKYGKLIII